LSTSTPAVTEQKPTSFTFSVTTHLITYSPDINMPADKTFATFVAVEAGFVATGTMMLIFALNTQASIARPFTIDNVARDLLLQECPVRGMSI
jgi:hypothetical protein